MTQTLLINWAKKTGAAPPEPDDCPACKGARGFEEMSGCMGGMSIRPCLTCQTTGKISQGERELFSLLAVHKTFKEKMVPQYAKIVDAAVRWVRGKKEYRDLLDSTMMPPSNYYEAIQAATERKTKGKEDLFRLVQELETWEVEYKKALGK